MQLTEMKSSWPASLSGNVLRTYKTLYYPGKLSDLPKWYDITTAKCNSSTSVYVCALQNLTYLFSNSMI